MKFISHQNKKIGANLSWLLLDRFSRLLVGFAVGIWLARYLGPAQMGDYSYAMTFIALFGTVANLGMQDVVFKKILENPDSKNNVIGTAFALSFLAGLASFLFILFAYRLWKPDDLLIFSLLAISGMKLIFQSTRVLTYSLSSRLQSKHFIPIQLLMFLIVALIKITLIHFEAGLVAFAWAFLLESILCFFAVLIIYEIKDSHIKSLKICYVEFISILKLSWPLLISTVSATLLMVIDKIMIMQMEGNVATGIYSMSTRFSQLAVMLPALASASIFPSIIHSHNISNSNFYATLQKYFFLMTWLGLSTWIILFILGKFLIGLYGTEYSSGLLIHLVHSSSLIFVCQWIAREKWSIMKGYQIHSLFFMSGGCVFNIALNFILIRQYGALGAAISTVITQLLVALILPLFFKKSRHTALMLLKSFYKWN